MTANSIAFGSAPRREADSQPISQLDRPAVSQTETHTLGLKWYCHTAHCLACISHPALSLTFPARELAFSYQAYIVCNCHVGLPAGVHASVSGRRGSKQWGELMVSGQAVAEW